MSVLITFAGALTTVQDRGRLGWAHLGVPRAGALDCGAAALANRLVGNSETAAVLETTITGMGFVARRSHLIAVTGATCVVRVDGRAVPWAEPVSVRAGCEVTVGPAQQGVRSYVALGGGILVDPVLGSRSTDTLAWVGPPPLRAGDRVPVGSGSLHAVGVDVHRRSPRGRVLRLHPGPRADWALDLADLDGADFIVGERSNRIGLRLEGRTVRRERQEELASEGLVLGAVQLPPSGHPVVFLNDHPVTGGYPVVAVVLAQDLALCAQARPGDKLRLEILG